MANIGFEPVSEILGDEREHRRKIAQKLNVVLRGGINCTIDVVVTPSALTTTITDSRISPFCFMAAMAQDATGSADVVGLFFDTFLTGSCVMHHRSAPGVRSLRILILD